MTALRLIDSDAPVAVDADPGLEFSCVNLLNDLDGLAGRLQESLEAGNWLDSFLLTAGMNQVAEDYLHRDVLMLARVSANLAGLHSTVGIVARLSSEAARRFGFWLRGGTKSERRVRSWQLELEQLTQELAERVVELPREASSGGLEIRARSLLQTALTLPLPLRRSVLRLPTCFQSLDQRPADCGALAERFAQRWPDRVRPVRVLGLRTSGSYLAPLVAAYLKRMGYADASAWTVRPGQELQRIERDRFLSVVASNAMLVVVDDPPKSGRSYLRAVEWLHGKGFPRDQLVLLVPLTGTEAALPSLLTGHQTVALPWPQWDIHDCLQPEAVEETIGQLLVGRDIVVTRPNGKTDHVLVRAVTGVRRLEDPPLLDLKSGSPVRRHVRAVFEVGLRIDAGDDVRHHVYAKGVGVGYFGGHSVTVANALEGFVPETYGLRNGLLFRAWIPEAERVAERTVGTPVVETIADYVLARKTRLAVPADISERLVGMNPVWQRVADMLATPFGKGRWLVRPFTHAAARRLLRVMEPSVIDGSMAIGQWFHSTNGGDCPLKVDYDERAYSNQDTVVDQLYSFDAVFDLAAAAADLMLCAGEEGAALAAGLRKRFEAQAGAIGNERWWLYQMLVLKSHRQFLESMRTEVEEGTVNELPPATRALLQPAAFSEEQQRLRRLMTSLDHDYLRDLLLADLAPVDDGPLCAIDIDGVLETDHLGYSTVTPLGALVLRSLIAHGYRPILATGRGVEEVRERCRAFGLAAGVAEYGAAFYDHQADQVHDLVSEPDRVALERLRFALSSVEDVHLASGYHHTVRASVVANGKERPLSGPLVGELLDRCHITGEVRAVSGWAQTDFIATRNNKASGLEALLMHIRPTQRQDGPPLWFAIGDGAEDVPMLALAKIRAAPANAEAAVLAAGAQRMPGRYQSGLAQAAAMVIGHKPGTCARCRMPSVTKEAGIVLTALRAQEDGKVSKLRQAARLAAQTMTT